MIKSKQSNYRIGSEPLHTIVKSLKLDIEFEYVEELDIFEQLEQLVKISENNEKFNKHISNSLKALRSLEPLYNEILNGTKTGHFDLNFARMFCIQLQCFIQDNKYKQGGPYLYLIKGSLPTITDFLFVECLQIINNQWPNIIYEYSQDLYCYMARVQSIPIFQSYYFNVDFMMKDFAEKLPNKNKVLREIIQLNIKTFYDFAICEGVLYRYRENEKEYTDNCPVSLYPLYINEEIIDDLKKKTILQQQVIAKMSRSYDFYTSILQKLAKHDDFINRMLAIQSKVEKSQTSSPFTFCIVRNDFLNHGQLDQWMQVEYNCIAISFGYISDKVQNYHNTLINSYYQKMRDEQNIKVLQDQNEKMMINALKNAYQCYGVVDSIVLIITAEFEGNIYDQRYVEKGLAQNGMMCIRTTFIKLIGNLTNENGILKAFGKEVALVYFRTGYTSDQYENEECWKIRELIELSKAVKCPNMSTQLVNFKKLQQVLLDDEQLQKFLTKQESEKIKENYCKIWGFENNQDHEQIIEMIKQNPHDYVLKPQREGGGNNFYDDQIIPELLKVEPEQRNEYILMERIKPIPRVGFMLKKGQLDIQAVISEISVIGYFITEKEKIIHNEVGGYLVRTKRYLDNEGGVAAGYAVVDSFIIHNKKLNY